MVLKILICRSVKDGRTPGSAVGYNCAECNEALQVSAVAQGQLKVMNDAKILCTKCGLRAAEEAFAAGTLDMIGLTPAALEQLRRMHAEGKI